MHDAVIDTGPFIHLDEIQRLPLLQAVFKTIHVPEQVIRELSNQSALSFIEHNQQSIYIEPVQDEELFSVKDVCSGFRLHPADRAIIVLLNKFSQAIACTDDLELRRAIESSGRTVVGTIGILFKSYQLELLDKSQLKHLLSAIFNDSSLYLSSSFRNKVISIAEEL